MLIKARRLSGKLDPEAHAQLLSRSQELELASFQLASKWLPKVKEWELKVELGEQIWQEARHVDALWRGRRELVEASEPPQSDSRVGELGSIVGSDACTACFLVSLYGVLKPRLLEMYQDHARLADPVTDASTVRLLKRIIRDEVRQIEWGERATARLDPGRCCGREEDKRKSMADYLAAEFAVNDPSGRSSPGHSGYPGGDPTIAAVEGDRMMERTGAEVRYTVLALGVSQVFPEPGDAPEGMLRRLHRLATREMLTAEIVARSVAEHPDMPWEFMLDMARICREEVRRAEDLRRRMEQLGGRLGMYPIHAADWALYQHRVKLDLAYRLCDLALLGEGPLEGARAAMGKAQRDPLTADAHSSGAPDDRRNLRSSVRWLNWLTADVGKLQQIVARGKRLRAKAGLAEIPAGDPITLGGGAS